MTWKVILRPEAKLDVRHAADWYKEQQIGLEKRFVDEILVVENVLAEQPLIYPIIFQNVRRATIKTFPFAIYYFVEEQKVIILAIVHMHRNPEFWKSRV